MTNYELYINGELTDIGPGFNVRLNRQLINPAELNTKDAQYSYSVMLPPTDRNQRIFNYANIEETRDKFNRAYTAELIVNGVRIFTGYFRMSEIANGFKGNLYIPSYKTIKDIFGQLALNQHAPYLLPFTDFVTSVNLYNNAALTGPQIAIFPYALYGLLPKVPLNSTAGTYSARTLWDNTVRLGMGDLAPSINPLLMLKHIFNSAGYNLTGTAFDDVRIANTYMSYKNGTDYVQPWNYGQHAKIQINGAWASTYNRRTGNPARELERGVNRSYEEGFETFLCDIFDATNTKVNVTQDTGGNVSYKEVKDADNVPWVRCAVRIPVAGYYKVELSASLQVFANDAWRTTDPITGVQHVSGQTDNARNTFLNNIYEVRLMRDRKTADFGLTSGKIDGTFYRNNLPQNIEFDEENIPKYFPQVNDNGQVNFIDAAQDPKLITGFSFGRRPLRYAGSGANTQLVTPLYQNPKDPTEKLAQVLAAKPALSWDTTADPENPTKLAIKSPGYWKYGRLGDFDNEGDNPDIDIDYSGGTRVIGKILDVQGNPQTPPAGNLDARVNGYYISPSTGFPVASPTWQVSEFIDLRNYTGMSYTSEVVGGAEGAALSAFYDINKQFLGYGFIQPAPSITDSYTAASVVAPAEAAYVRFSAQISEGMDVTATDVTADNVILHRFSLNRVYTYVFDAGIGYTGKLYVHSGTAPEVPVIVADFIDGVATITPSLIISPRVTLYLKTSQYDVDGTLTISRRIIGSEDDEDDSAAVIDYELTDKYQIALNNAPTVYAKRGQYDDLVANGLWNAQGNSAVVVWLEAGELITLASVSGEGRYRQDGMHSTFGWVNHELKYDLSIQPFRTDPDWLKVGYNGNGTAVMDWNDTPNFETDNIDLVQFLNTDMKTDDFIDQFCKALNLKLSQTDIKTFTLDVKQKKTALSNRYISLDGLTSVPARVNQPLGLPSIYKLGFTVDTEEEGYVVSGDNGGGEYGTGAREELIVEQKSSFSYNWFKNITKSETGGDVVLPLPVISKAEVWNSAVPYAEAMVKRYTDQAYRFWYFDGLLNNLGATFFFNGVALQIAKVAGSRPGSILNYKNQPFTILDNFFTIVVDGGSDYTIVEGYLSPIQYGSLDGSVYAQFNGDLYYVAEISGYDPAGKNKTQIKLIRKI